MRAFFYLADGLAIGGGLMSLFWVVGLSVFLLYRGLLDGIASAGVVLLVLLFGYVLAHRTAAFREASRTSPEDPPEVIDWAETRDWTTMGLVVLLIAGGGLGLLLVLWTVSGGWALLVSFFFPVVVTLSGLVCRLYGFGRLGVRVL